MAETKDRRLGDEWLNWDGDLENYEGVIEEGKGTFLTFSTLVILLSLGALALFWYLIKPRIYEAGERVGLIISLTCLAIGIGVLLWFSLLVISIITERRWVAFQRLNFILTGYLVSKATWLGEKFGISRDRMGNSFVAVNNALFRALLRGKVNNKPLILLPRCLTKENREEVMALVRRYGCRAFVCGGGDVARKIVKEQKPSTIIGVACERDLVSGIRDVGPKIPVIGIANKRPEGPCKNAYIRLEELEAALRFHSPMSEGPGRSG